MECMELSIVWIEGQIVKMDLGLWENSRDLLDETEINVLETIIRNDKIKLLVDLMDTLVVEHLHHFDKNELALFIDYTLIQVKLVKLLVLEK